MKNTTKEGIIRSLNYINKLRDCINKYFDTVTINFSHHYSA